MKNDETNRPDNAAGEATHPALTIDYALYESYLEDSDWSESEKRQFLDALWSIIVGFVDLGFQLHVPDCQTGSDICLASESGDVISSTYILNSNASAWTAGRHNQRPAEKTES